MDLGDLLVSEELPDLKDSWDLKEMGATLALLEMLVLREKLECLDYRGNLENLVRMETLDPLDQLGGRAREVFLECLVFLDLKATEDFLDSMEPKETLGLLEKRVRMVLLVLWEQLVLLDPQAHEEKEEGMDLLACLDLGDWMEPLDLLETWELWESLVVQVFLVFLEQRETLVVMVLREVLECRVPEENLESLECQENLVSLDHLERMEVMERREDLVCQELLGPQDSLDQEDSQALMVAQVPMDQRE